MQMSKKPSDPNVLLMPAGCQVGFWIGLVLAYVASAVFSTSIKIGINAGCLLALRI